MTTLIVHPIRTDQDYEQALARISALMDLDPPSGSPEGDELEVLTVLAEHYEAEHYPVREPSPIDTIQWERDQGFGGVDLLNPIAAWFNHGPSIYKDFFRQGMHTSTAEFTCKIIASSFLSGRMLKEWPAIGSHEEYLLRTVVPKLKEVYITFKERDLDVRDANPQKYELFFNAILAVLEAGSSEVNESRSLQKNDSLLFSVSPVNRLRIPATEDLHE